MLKYRRGKSTGLTSSPSRDPPQPHHKLCPREPAFFWTAPPLCQYYTPALLLFLCACMRRYRLPLICGILFSDPPGGFPHLIHGHKLHLGDFSIPTGRIYSDMHECMCCMQLMQKDHCACALWAQESMFSSQCFSGSKYHILESACCACMLWHAAP